MYNDEFEHKENSVNPSAETEQQKAEEHQEQEEQEKKEVNFTMIDSHESSSSSEGQNAYGQAQSQPAGQSTYGQSQSQAEGQNAYGQAQSQPAGQSTYGQSQNVYSQNQASSGQTYGSSRPSYGNSQQQSASGYGTGYQGSYQQNHQSQPGGTAQDQHQQNQGQIQHYAPWQHKGSYSGQNQEKKQRRPKNSHPILKRAAGVTAAALLFGVVAGGTISGITLITGRIADQYAQTRTTIAQAETVPAATQGSSDSSAPAVTVAANDVSAIVEKAMPSVVAINSITEVQTQNWFGQPQTYEGRGSGSGIIVGESDTELLIVTNNHVVEGASSLSVTFNDNQSAEANVKGTDSENDLAVIAVPLNQIDDSTKSKIAVATLGDSDNLKVGQGVIAIGNALGYGQSVTVGYVSALDREVTTEDGTTRNLLQTDAAINPGNSGGALLNMQGEVVGINSAKYSSTEVEGMGYAIPISKVQDIIDTLMTRKTRVQVAEDQQGYMGIQGTDIDSNASTLYGMPQGIYVYKIMEDGAAASSTLQEKDIITKFDGQSVRSMSELQEMLTYYAGGDTVELTVERLENGQYVEQTVEITLGTRPAEENTNR